MNEPMASELTPMLSVRKLAVEFESKQGVVRAVNDVSFTLARGEILGIVGESGSGKSVTVQTIMGLLSTPPGKVVSGTVQFEGHSLLEMTERQWGAIRGKEIAMVFQEPVAVLNPIVKVGSQLVEAIRAHDKKLSAEAARSRAIDLLRTVRVPLPEARVDEYPHQFSGGMAQRVAIAIAIANHPKLLIADEPTTALDVTVQAQVMQALRRAQQQVNAAMILITHDLGLVAEIADRIIVMYAGRVVEAGQIAQIFSNPQHPYTVGLMSSIPRLDVRARRLRPIPGQPPSLSDSAMGCAFEPRCPIGRGNSRCQQLSPPLEVVESGHQSACHLVDEVRALAEGALT